MTRRRLLVVGLVVGLVVVALVWSFWPRGTSEVSEEDALEDFRDRDTETETPTDGVPAPGVYTLRATGQEEVKLGPLPTETRPLPDTVTAVAVDLGDGCFDWTVNLFAEHTEDTRYCSAADGGLVLESHTKHQQIGPLSPTGAMTCDPAALVVPGTETVPLTCELNLTGGPAAITASLIGTATTGDPETLTIGGTDVEATPVSIGYDISGDLDGTWSETLWLTSDRLPVRIERTLDLSGPATFTEQSDLELVDLTPTT